MSAMKRQLVEEAGCTGCGHLHKCECPVEPERVTGAELDGATLRGVAFTQGETFDLSYDGPYAKATPETLEPLHGAEPFPEPTATEVLDAQMRLMTYWHAQHNAANPPCSFAAFLQCSWVIGDAKRWLAQHGVAGTNAWLDAQPLPPGGIVGSIRGGVTTIVEVGNG